jgi:hypothetical protein
LKRTMRYGFFPAFMPITGEAPRAKTYQRLMNPLHRPLLEARAHSHFLPAPAQFLNLTLTASQYCRRSCADEWLKNHRSCPVCKTDIQASDPSLPLQLNLNKSADIISFLTQSLGSIQRIFAYSRVPSIPLHRRAQHPASFNPIPRPQPLSPARPGAGPTRSRPSSSP